MSQINIQQTFLWAPIHHVSNVDREKAMEFFINAIISSLPASEKCLEEYSKEQQQNDTFSQILAYCKGDGPTINT